MKTPQELNELADRLYSNNEEFPDRTISRFVSDVNQAAHELRHMAERLAEEKAIVDRVWKALGITTYEQAKPLAIDEHVTKLRADLHEAAELLRETMDWPDMRTWRERRDSFLAKLKGTQ